VRMPSWSWVVALGRSRAAWRVIRYAGVLARVLSRDRSVAQPSNPALQPSSGAITSRARSIVALHRLAVSTILTATTRERRRAPLAAERQAVSRTVPFATSLYLNEEQGVA